MESELSGSLQRYQVFDTCDPDELATLLGRHFGGASVDMPGRNAKLRCRIRYFCLGDISIIHGNYDSGFRVNFPEFQVLAGSSTPLKGVAAHKIGGKEVSVSKDHGAIVSPGGATLYFGPYFEHFSLIVQPAVLMEKLATIVGDLHLGALHFDPTINGCNPQAKLLTGLLRTLATEANVSWPMPPLMQSELQQLIITSFLMASANNYSELLHGESIRAAPWQVRRAEQFIEANWDQPITIDALVAETNISARSLFSSFRAARGYSPMQFVKQVRLRHARQKLLRPDLGTSVSAVVFECGFGNPGHFAADYHQHFGEHPSETLRRGRRGYEPADIKNTNTTHRARLRKMNGDAHDYTSRAAAMNFSG